MKPTNHDLEAISIRRAKVADVGKIRYRVYSTPNDFVAVIADSALMAVKTAGITKPYKIMRDSPTDGIAIEAGRMAVHEETPERVSFTTKETPKMNQHVVDFPEQGPAPKEPFIPLGISELRTKETSKLRILSPDMVNEIIDNHAKTHSMSEPVAEASPTPPEPVVQSATLSEPSVEEKMKQLAEEVLPSAADLDPADLPPPNHREPLSPEEVKKLLNE
jgi:hypothetical protein